MATAKKAKKTAKRSKSVRTASPKQRKIENMSPEEMLENLPVAREEHNREVKDLGERIINVIAKSKYHPTVALDAMQTLISIGIGDILGEEHKMLFDDYITRFHEESKMLSLLGLFEGIAQLRAEGAEPASEPTDAATPAASTEPTPEE